MHLAVSGILDMRNALQDQETDYSTDYWLPGDGGLGGSRRILSIRRVTAGVKD